MLAKQSARHSTPFLGVIQAHQSLPLSPQQMPGILVDQKHRDTRAGNLGIKTQRVAQIGFQIQMDLGWVGRIKVEKCGCHLAPPIKARAFPMAARNGMYKTPVQVVVLMYTHRRIPIQRIALRNFRPNKCRCQTAP
jgi:hypothetical protein